MSPQRGPIPCPPACYPLLLCSVSQASPWLPAPELVLCAIKPFARSSVRWLEQRRFALLQARGNLLLKP